MHTRFHFISNRFIMSLIRVCEAFVFSMPGIHFQFRPYRADILCYLCHGFAFALFYSSFFSRLKKIIFSFFFGCYLLHILLFFFFFFIFFSAVFLSILDFVRKSKNVANITRKIFICQNVYIVPRMRSFISSFYCVT